VSKADIVEAFIDSLCLRKALSEIRSGSMVLAFRHICLSLATYPGTALRNPKFYAAVVGVLAGPFGRLASRAGYALGIWRGRPLRMPAAR